MTPDLLRQLLSPGWETRHVECKRSHRLQARDWLTLKTVRACLGFANLAGGGFVIVGVKEDRTRGVLDLEGFDDSSPDLSTWTHDGVGDLLSRYCEPTPRFEVNRVPLDGRTFVVIRLHEFDEDPVICARTECPTSPLARQKEQVLTIGTIYVRGDGRAETRAPESADEVRAVLQLALQKRLARFAASAHAAGLQLGSGGPTADDHYQTQLESISGSPSPTLQRIRDPRRGWSRTIIAPTRLRERRIRRPKEFQEIIETVTVRQQGYAFFPAHSLGDVRQGRNCVSSSVDNGVFLLEWYLHDNGLFLEWQGLREDWRDSDGKPPASNRRRLGLGSVVLRCTLAYALAARLAGTPLGDAEMGVSITFDGMQGRRLDGGDTHVLFLSTPPSPVPVITSDRTIPRAELIATWPELALDAVEDILAHFDGHSVSRDALRASLGDARRELTLP